MRDRFDHRLRTFFVYLYAVFFILLFYATQVKEHIVGPLNLFGHCAVTHHYCFDLNYETSSHPLRGVDRFSSHLAIVLHNDSWCNAAIRSPRS